MTEPRVPIEKETVVHTPEATRVHKSEVRIVVIGALLVYIIGMGGAFMLPFPQLLEVYIWGFPFPFWYQFTINWFGPILLGWYICHLLNKNDDAKENVGRGVR
jgi:hypothetical protein